MKRISHVISLLLLVGGFPQLSQAEGIAAEFTAPHEKSVSKLGTAGEVVVHQIGEYQVVAVHLFAGATAMTVHELKAKGTSDMAYRKLMTKNTLVVASGSFFGFSPSGREKPIGLVRSQGKRLVSLMPWSHGGVIVSDAKGSVKVIAAENASQAGAWSEALQSKPIIIINNVVDVSKSLRDAEFNRVAIGVSKAGDVLIVGAFHGFGQAATLVQFAEIYKKIADEQGIMVIRALAMDGGAGAQISIPSLKLRFGDSGVSYFPNAVRFDSVHAGKN
ncbi:phosphodiester glycosidase family protein [Pseudomonas syringae]|uniref:phosphodiester glycosidase family protein n=1 Tax=Pseudomonas syringae TaxID=317 RepID=UPI003F83F840